MVNNSMNIWETIKELIDLVTDNQSATNEKTFLSLLDKLAFQISTIEWRDPSVGKEVPENDYRAIRKAAESAFPNWGFYNVAGEITKNIGECDVHVGDAIDDVTDIINDLKMVYWSYQNESE